MRRKLFFFLERLQVSRKERLALGFLGGCLILLSTLNLVVEKKARYDTGYYEELEQVFGERSRQAKQERERIMSRYRPQEEVLPDADTSALHEASEPDFAAGPSSPNELSPASGHAPEGEESPSGPPGININTAGISELQKLPGIGPAYAGRIIEWRRRNGPFTSVEQLLAVRGIGVKRLETLRRYVTL